MSLSRTLSSLSSLASLTLPTLLSSPPAGFTFLSRFLSRDEQLLLTKAALDHLDNVGTSAERRKRRQLLRSGEAYPDQHGFLAETCYQFQRGHFDEVIRHFRESRITDAQWASLSGQNGERLGKILERLRSLLPPVPLMTHVLHLSSHGEILPHVDNVNASGSIILGVSLGTARILRLENDEGHVYDQLLEPGSCYIQRDSVRYRFKHSILNAGTIDGISIQPGQRISIMMRDMPPNSKRAD